MLTQYGVKTVVEGDILEQFKIYVKIIELFPGTKTNRGKRFEMNCPNCGYVIKAARHQRNGHLRAECETKNCFACIE